MSETEHDKLCPYWTFYDDDCPHSPCQCDLIAEVRDEVRPRMVAETREAVAQELDERAEDMDKAANAAGDRGNYEAAIRMGALADTYREAAKVARAG